jgi:hypothetical protein
MDKEYYKAIQSVHDIDKTIIDLMDQLIPLVESFDSPAVTQSLIDLLDAMTKFAERLVIMHIQRLQGSMQ